MPSFRLLILNIKSKTSSLVIISLLKPPSQSASAPGSNSGLQPATYSAKKALLLYGLTLFAPMGSAIMFSAVVLPLPLPPQSMVTGSNSSFFSPFSGKMAKG